MVGILVNKQAARGILSFNVLCRGCIVNKDILVHYVNVNIYCFDYGSAD
jgi:hypothetical protein